MTRSGPSPGHTPPESAASRPDRVAGRWTPPCRWRAAFMVPMPPAPLPIDGGGMRAQHPSQSGRRGPRAPTPDVRCGIGPWVSEYATLCHGDGAPGQDDGRRRGKVAFALCIALPYRAAALDGFFVDWQLVELLANDEACKLFDSDVHNPRSQVVCKHDAGDQIVTRPAATMEYDCVSSEPRRRSEDSASSRGVPGDQDGLRCGIGSWVSEIGTACHGDGAPGRADGRRRALKSPSPQSTSATLTRRGARRGSTRLTRRSRPTAPAPRATRCRNTGIAIDPSGNGWLAKNWKEKPHLPEPPDRRGRAPQRARG